MLAQFPFLRRIGERRLLHFCSNHSRALGPIPSSPSPSSSSPSKDLQVNDKEITVNGIIYAKDAWTNVTPKVLSLLGRNLHLQKYHPLSHIRQRIVGFMYNHFPRRGKSPLFSVYDNLHPVVTTEQNFDSLLVPQDHPSRRKSDCYYLNQDHLFRAHTSAHQIDLIRAGLTNFLVVGDVYRRDEIDSTHYPVFHQVEGVRLCGHHEVFKDESTSKDYSMFETMGNWERTNEKQECHSRDAVYIMGQELKSCLLGLAQHLFGKNVETRWVDTYFPFTHPSWELEVKHDGTWLEVLGCGIMEQALLKNAGAGDKIGWAFGLGLERLAMRVYQIPDIRIFWSNDSGILHQFQVDDPYSPITFKTVSQYPQCPNDISFWLPMDATFSSNDFYDLVRTVGGDLVEQVSLVDKFEHPKKKTVSHCYRIVYRDMTRTLLQAEVNRVHNLIAEAAVKELKVQIR